MCHRTGLILGVHAESLGFRRGIFFLFSLGVALFVAGCTSFPRSAESELASGGAHSTSVSHWPGVTLARNQSILPGTGSASFARAHQWECRSEGLHLEILAADNVSGADGLCSSALTALDWTRSLLRADYDMVYSVKLVPPGYRYRDSRSSLSFGDRLKLQFALRWDGGSTRDSVAPVIRLLSHETVHAVAARAGLPKSIRTDEALAYRIGVCAQLQVIGELQLSDLPKGYVAANSGASESALASSSAGYALTQTLSPRFVDGVMTRDSGAGRELLDSCKAAAAVFGMPNR